VRRFFRGILGYGVWLGGLALIAVHLSGYAQTIPSLPRLTSGAGSELDKLFGGKTSVTPTGEVVFEGAIDPDAFVLGPGDRLNLIFWQPTYQEYPCVVSGEGNIVVPYVGIQEIAGLTLTQARARLDSTVAATLRIGKISILLVEPRRFRVHVAGLVTNPGTYTVPATARVADAVDLAGGLRRERNFARGDTASRILASERRIEIWNPDGSRAGHADLLLFRQGGLTKANPYLRDGQTVYAKAPETFRQVGVFGAVGTSGSHEFVEGDCVADLIALGGGLAANADSSSVAVVAADGVRTPINLQIAGDRGTAFRLQSGDRVYVAGFPDTSRAGSVVVRGEIARPGGYPIIIGETTLREILQAAGGLLPSAAANSARLVRTTATDLVEPERFRVFQSSTMQMQPFKTDLELAAEFARWNYGTVVLDLTDAARDNSDGGNLRLHDGDVLEVPSNPLGVRVLGAVNHAGEVDWISGGKLGDYLSLAGGINKVGWKSRTVVIKARNGSRLQYQSSLPIDPGDVIFVPNKMQMTTWDLVKDFVAVTAQVVTIVLVIQNLGN
jgi:polysaccharide biosynthesis/export protein